MSELELGALVAVVTTIVLMLGVPIAYGLAGVSVAVMLYAVGPQSLIAVPRIFLEEVNGFAMISLPMFILLGSIVGRSAASTDIHEAAHRLFKRIPGGLVIANIMACGMFSAICGSSPATAAAIGRSGIPEMRARGVPPRLAAGAICAGGTLGILIPPSITLILYGIATGTSIGQLFLAGVAPGILLVVFFSAYAWLASIRKIDEPVVTMHKAASQPSPAFVGLRALPFLVLILLVIASLYSGIATPSEGAALAALLAIILVVVLYRTSLADWLRIGQELVRDSSMVLMIIAASGLFSYMLSLTYITQAFGDFLVVAGLGKWTFFIYVSIFLLIAGCFLPPVALILVVMPIIQPSLENYGFDLLWFGIIMTILMEVGLITPPVGVNLFVVRGIAPDISLKDILIGSMPFVLVMLAAIVLFAIYPQIVTWLPSTVHAN